MNPPPRLLQALLHLEAATTLNSEDPRFRARFGEGLLAAGDDLGAEKQFAMAVKLGAGARVEALWAVALARLGSTAAAKAVASDALVRRGDFALGHYASAVAEAAEGDAYSAAASLERAARHAPNGRPFLHAASLLHTDGLASFAGTAKPPTRGLLRLLLHGLSELRRPAAEEESS